MGLVDDQGVVGIQVTIMGGFRQQDTVGHELDVPIRAHSLPKTNLVTHRPAQFRSQLLGNPVRHGPGRDTARLRAPDQAARATARLQAHLR